VDIAEWLQGLGLGRYAPAFAENAINWDVLPELTADDLKEIGVAAVGDRRRLLAAIAALRGSAVPTAPVAPVATSPSDVPAAAERRHLTRRAAPVVPGEAPGEAPPGLLGGTHASSGKKDGSAAKARRPKVTGRLRRRLCRRRVTGNGKVRCQ